MFFDSWPEIAHVAFATALVFATVVILLRTVGAQAIAQMSGYDMVATVTLGSIVATVGVNRNVSIATGATALLTLVVLQEVLRFFQSRYLFAHHLVRSPAIVVLWEGMLLEDRLRQHRISADEVRAIVRRQGFASLADMRLVVLENDGEWSVIARGDAKGDDSALFGLPIPDRPNNSTDAEGHLAEPIGPLRLP